MNLTLKRIYLGDEYTIGHLYIDGKYFCDTLEDKNRDINKNGKFDNGEIKIYGETCIPFGIYEVKITWSERFKKYMPQVMNVPEFTGIRIHSGNTKEDSLGCILLGYNKIKGKVINSRETCNLFYNIVQIAVNKGEKIILTIV